jgi:fido (protein-threonine AMPylation protein)
VLVRRIGRWAGRHHDVGTWKGQWSYDSFRVHKTVIKRKRPKMEKSDFLKKKKKEKAHRICRSSRRREIRLQFAWATGVVVLSPKVSG